jgi:hypothetical protein
MPSNCWRPWKQTQGLFVVAVLTAHASRRNRALSDGALRLQDKSKVTLNAAKKLSFARTKRFITLK